MSDGINTVKPLMVNQERLWATHLEMGRIGALPKGGCCRLALSEEDRLGRDLFIRWSREAGCEIKIDEAGNIFARRSGRRNDLPAVATGSHLDTQPHAGLFDGIFGVLAGLEIFRTLNEAAIVTEAPLEAIVWTNEECVRFPPPTSGSLAFVGKLDIAELHAMKTTDGTTVREDLERWNYLGENISFLNHKLGCFIEAHIEQGPVLEEAAKTIGIVTGIQGARMFSVEVIGQDNHAGTTPMNLRRDALTGATRMVTLLNRLAIEDDPAVRLTVGRFDVSPNAPSTVPGGVIFEIDLRHPQEDRLDRLEAEIREILKQTAASSGLEVKVGTICAIPPVLFDKTLLETIRQQCARLGYRQMDMFSGAGHDAGNLAQIVPTAMIFVPCEKGISHNEAEMAAPADLACGANVLLHTMLAKAGIL